MRQGKERDRREEYRNKGRWRNKRRKQDKIGMRVKEKKEREEEGRK